MENYRTKPMHAFGFQVQCGGCEGWVNQVAADSVADATAGRGRCAVCLAKEPIVVEVPPPAEAATAEAPVVERPPVEPMPTAEAPEGEAQKEEPQPYPGYQPVEAEPGATAEEAAEGEGAKEEPRRRR